MKERLFPPFFYAVKKPLKRKNRMSLLTRTFRKISEVYIDDDKSKYVPYYHLYADKKSAPASLAGLCRKVVRCEIPKKLITEIGTENEHIVIVTKGYNIVGQDAYLD